jgi:hypothetical protein
MKISTKVLFPHRQMQFQPVEDDDDELSNLIRNDTNRHDDQWQLTDDLDGAKLDAFWDDALKELGAESVEQD